MVVTSSGISKYPIRPNIMTTETLIGSVANSPPTKDRNTIVIITKITITETSKLINCPLTIIRLNTPSSVAPPVSSIGASS